MADSLYTRYGCGAKPGYAPSDALAELIWIEWKSPKGRAALHQLAWHAREQFCGALALIAGVDFPATLEGFFDWYKNSCLHRRSLRIGPAKPPPCAPSLDCPESWTSSGVLSTYNLLEASGASLASTGRLMR